MLALPLMVVVHHVNAQSAVLRVEATGEEEEMETTTTKETAMRAT